MKPALSASESPGSETWLVAEVDPNRVVAGQDGQDFRLGRIRVRKAELRKAIAVDIRHRDHVLVLAILAALSTACSSTTNHNEVGLIGQTASGGQIDFNALEGTDTVLWFWAPW